MHTKALPIWVLSVLAFLAPHSALADDSDALSLESAPVIKPDDASQRRLYLEGALGSTRQRYGLGTVSSHRISIDYAQDFSLANNWRLTLSDRLDHLNPEDVSGESTINSLREAYVLWRGDDGKLTAEFGRVNLRLGPAYGYNPTDYFRTGSLRTVTSADPLALRQNRMGTVMFRTQRLWRDGAVSLALAPKLSNAPSKAGFNPDFGSTNRLNRVLASLSANFSDQISGQAHLYSEKGTGSQAGVSLTALLSKSAVGYAEFTHGRSDLNAGVGPTSLATRSRASTGVTYTLPTNLALTFEYEYNGFGLRKSEWIRLDPSARTAYLAAAQDRQDIAARRAWLIYATQSNVGIKNVDLTGLLRVNGEDQSRLVWIELRYHWAKLDGAVQMTWSRGDGLTEYGMLPLKQAVQFLLTWHL